MRALEATLTMVGGSGDRARGDFARFVQQVAGQYARGVLIKLVPLLSKKATLPALTAGYRPIFALIW